ncbi:MAG: response regulator [Thermodesulfobacteriota bacterium]|nr:response regulator [Thermodesulfobacteriota bacterium]
MSEMDKKPRLLIVDDSPEIIDMLVKLLEKDYQLLTATNGDDALKVAMNNEIDLILLDIIMPGIDGFEVCEKLKANDKTKSIVVVFITGEADTASIVRGLEAGAYYYLTKPVNIQILQTIIKTALSDQTIKNNLQDEVKKSTEVFMTYLKEGRFSIRTIEDASILSVLLAKCCPEPQRIVSGLMELLNNAVEHGNLGITYKDKSRLLECAEWEIEVKKRLNLPENMSKRVIVLFENREHENRFLIKDQGPGFDWKPYLTFDPRRMLDPNGRGIAMAKNLNLDRVEYQGVGNEVLAVVNK